jgi:hypothetical protein
MKTGRAGGQSALTKHAQTKAHSQPRNGLTRVEDDESTEDDEGSLRFRWSAWGDDSKSTRRSGRSVRLWCSAVETDDGDGTLALLWQLKRLE